MTFSNNMADIFSFIVAIIPPVCSVIIAVFTRRIYKELKEKRNG